MSKSSELTKGIGILGAVFLKFAGGAGITPYAGAPTNGTSGTFAGTPQANPGSILLDVTNKAVYQNTNTQASPTWSPAGLSAAGQFATSVTVGGTGVAAAAATATKQTKAVTGMADTVATATFTVTVPNAKHGAIINVDVIATLGAGGAIGAGEGSRVSRYQIVLARTAGVAVVATVSSAIGGAEAHVAGAASVSTAVVTASSITGAVGATNTFTINVAITKSGGASDNHTAVVSAEIVNEFATGVSIA